MCPMSTTWSGYGRPRRARHMNMASITLRTGISRRALLAPLISQPCSHRFDGYRPLVAVKLFGADLVLGDACAIQRPLHRLDHCRRADNVVDRRGQVADESFQHILSLIHISEPTR